MQIPKIQEQKLDIEKPVRFDRIYLAVSTVYDNMKYSVYTLGNNRAYRGYYATANINVAYFDNKKDADIYHHYIENIMKRQCWRLGYDMVDSARKLNSKVKQEFDRFILAIKTLEKQK